MSNKKTNTRMYRRFLDVLAPNEDRTNQEILSDIWQEVFHLLDRIPREVADIDAGQIAGEVQRQVECAMLRRYLDELDGGYLDKMDGEL